MSKRTTLEAIAIRLMNLAGEEVVRFTRPAAATVYDTPDVYRYGTELYVRWILDAEHRLVTYKLATVALHK